jgi:hypothetical protein
MALPAIVYAALVHVRKCNNLLATVHIQAATLHLTEYCLLSFCLQSAVFVIDNMLVPPDLDPSQPSGQSPPSSSSARAAASLAVSYVTAAAGLAVGIAALLG